MMWSNGRIRQAIAAALLLCALPTGLRARVMAQGAQAARQTPARESGVIGTISDATAAALPGAAVTAVSVDHAVSTTAVSDANGAYRLPLPPGNYRITAELSGFTPAVRERVEVADGAPITVDLRLPLSGLSETVAVTGTHLGESGFAALAPLQVETRQDIETTSVAAFSDLFKQIPGNSGSEAATEATPRAGQSQFNLRGLGYSSTLTLVNGRRAGIAPVTDETGAEYTDINQFPVGMVERVDVLKDGASAIYGSDAVAGVVNVVTRKGFTGIDASGGFQDASNRNGFASVATGRRFQRGMVNVYGTYYGQTGNNRTDFDWLVERVGGNGRLGRSQLLNDYASPSTYKIGGLNAQGQPVGIDNGVGFADPDCEAAGGVFRIRDDGSVDRGKCLYNFADQIAILPNANRAQVFAELSYQWSPRVRMATEASFSRNELETTKGPGSYSNGLVTNAQGSVFIPASHPFNFFQRDPADPTRLVYVPPSQWDPAVNKAVDVIALLRPLGGDAYNGDNAPKRRSLTTYPRVGSTFDIELGRAWTATAGYGLATADLSDRQPLRYDAAALNGAILNSTFNPFGTGIASPSLLSPKDGRSRAGNTQAVIDTFIVDSLDTARTSQQQADITAAGDLFTLGAQTVRLAAGAQFRHTTLETRPDARQSAGRGDVPTTQSPQSGSQNVTAAFAEIAAPLGGRAMAQVAARFEDYGRYGHTVNPKLAGTLVINRHANLRASWGTSFQAPTLFQTSESTTRLFLNDPVRLVDGRLTCRAQTDTSNVTVNTAGDPNLKPTHSANHNIGLVVESGPRLQFSLDYWNYRYTDLIAPSANAQALITADCKGDGIPNDPRIVRDGNGGIFEINTLFTNVGKVETDGVDLAVAMRWPLAGGALAATADATWLRRFDVHGGEGGAFDGAGSRNYNNNFRTMPRWRVVTGLNWTGGSQFIGARLRYISGYTNDQSNGAAIDDYMPTDLSYGYTLRIGGRALWTAMVGLDNAFNLAPPALVRAYADGTRIPNTDYQFIDRPGYDAYSGADLRGRVFWLRFSRTF